MIIAGLLGAKDIAYRRRVTETEYCRSGFLKDELF